MGAKINFNSMNTTICAIAHFIQSNNKLAIIKHQIYEQVTVKKKTYTVIYREKQLHRITGEGASPWYKISDEIDLLARDIYFFCISPCEFGANIIINTLKQHEEENKNLLEIPSYPTLEQVDRLINEYFIGDINKYMLIDEKDIKQYVIY